MRYLPPSKKKMVAYRGILFAPLDLVVEKLAQIPSLRPKIPNT